MENTLEATEERKRSNLDRFEVGPPALLDGHSSISQHISSARPAIDNLCWGTCQSDWL